MSESAVSAATWSTSKKRGIGREGGRERGERERGNEGERERREMEKERGRDGGRERRVEK